MKACMPTLLIAVIAQFGGAHPVFAQGVSSEFGRAFAESVAELHREIMISNRADDNLLTSYFDDLNVDQVAERLSRSAAANSELAELLLSDQGGLTTFDRQRWGVLTARAAEKSELGRQLVLGSVDNIKVPFNLFENGTAFSASIGGARTAEIEGLLQLFPTSGVDADAVAAGSAESLVDRFVKFGSLTATERSDVRKRLNHVATVDIEAAGSARQVTLLHSGFGIEAAPESFSCRWLFAEIVDGRGGRLGTLDLRKIWEDRLTKEIIPSMESRLRFGDIAPTYTHERERWLQQLSKNFVAINIYQSESPQPGDLVFVRFSNRTNGHVTLLKTVDAPKMMAEIYENPSLVYAATPDNPRTGDLRSRDWEMSLTAPEEGYRYYRPGLWVLRLAHSNDECPVIRQ